MHGKSGRRACVCVREHGERVALEWQCVDRCNLTRTTKINFLPDALVWTVARLSHSATNRLHSADQRQQRARARGSDWSCLRINSSCPGNGQSANRQRQLGSPNVHCPFNEFHGSVGSVSVDALESGPVHGRPACTAHNTKIMSDTVQKHTDRNAHNIGPG